jgi:hypothetical protein
MVLRSIFPGIAILADSRLRPPLPPLHSLHMVSLAGAVDAGSSPGIFEEGGRRQKGTGGRGGRRIIEVPPWLSGNSFAGVAGIKRGLLWSPYRMTAPAFPLLVAPQFISCSSAYGYVVSAPLLYYKRVIRQF